MTERLREAWISRKPAETETPEAAPLLVRMKTWIDAVRKFIPVPVRFVISSLIGAFIGSNYVRLVTEFGVYLFAVDQGFRPPFEGMPFLAATVSAASFVLLLAVTFAFALAYVLSDLVLVIMGTAVGKDLVSKPVLPLYFSAFAVIVALLLLFNWTNPGSHAAWAVPLGATAFFICVVYPTVKTWPLMKLFWAGVVALVFLIAPCYVLVKPTRVMGSLLRTMRYGGGIHVVVTLEEADDDGSTKIDGHMLMRTEKAIVLFRPEAGAIVEYRLEDVGKVTHVAGSTEGVEVKLPVP